MGQLLLLILSLSTSLLADAPTPKATPTFVPDVDPNDEDFQKRMQVLMDQPDGDMSGGTILPSGRVVYRKRSGGEQKQKVDAAKEAHK